MREFVEKFRDNSNLKKLCKEEGISYLAVFGSYARGEASENSDLDLLYRFKRSITYFQFYDVIERLTNLFGVKIDAVSDIHLREQFRDAIADDVGVLYEE